ncbi:hypothetical protein B0O99DRAFT_627515 [Bisporella sp. PMI_857]|nr:hypothetical protein B0O99DRAFT_627515 [Bisporella sp. PMI_857]
MAQPSPAASKAPDDVQARDKTYISYHGLEKESNASQTFSYGAAIFTTFNGFPGGPSLLTSEQKIQQRLQHITTQHEAVRKNIVALTELRAKEILAKETRESRGVDHEINEEERKRRRKEGEEMILRAGVTAVKGVNYEAKAEDFVISSDKDITNTKDIIGQTVEKAAEKDRDGDVEMRSRREEVYQPEVGAKAWTCIFWAGKGCNKGPEACRFSHRYTSRGFPPLRSDAGDATHDAYEYIEDQARRERREWFKRDGNREDHTMKAWTCYFWANGYCRQSEDECRYAHRHTPWGIAEQAGPGREAQKEEYERWRRRARDDEKNAHRNQEEWKDGDGDIRMRYSSPKSPDEEVLEPELPTRKEICKQLCDLVDMGERELELYDARAKQTFLDYKRPLERIKTGGNGDPVPDLEKPPKATSNASTATSSNALGLGQRRVREERLADGGENRRLSTGMAGTAPTRMASKNEGNQTSEQPTKSSHLSSSSMPAFTSNIPPPRPGRLPR